jgi:hypothetical protein
MNNEGAFMKDPACVYSHPEGIASFSPGLIASRSTLGTQSHHQGNPVKGWINPEHTPPPQHFVQKLRAAFDSRICYTIRMNTTPERLPKPPQRARAQAEFAKLLEAVNVRGFFGVASFTINVQDGHLEHMKLTVEKKIMEITTK